MLKHKPTFFFVLLSPIIILSLINNLIQKQNILITITNIKLYVF